VDEKPQTLEYARPKEKSSEPSELETELDDFVKGLSAGRLRSKWFYYQLGYLFFLVLLFWVIGWQLGPNLFNFGKLTRPTPAEFVEQVEKDCVPIVRAMKEFERDRGRLPNDMRELVPKYLPSDRDTYLLTVWNGGFRFRGKWDQAIIYDFTPGREGWYVFGGFTNGKIPLPPVKLPATQPTTRTN
jgi:hypothetical protein